MINDENKEDNLWKDLVARYLEVWLYSIQFGLVSALSFSLFQVRSDVGKWFPLGLSLALPLIVTAGCVLFAWKNLILYLTKRLIPKFILKDDENTASKEDTAYYLATAMRFSFMALTFRFCAFIFEIIMQSLNRY